MVVRKTAVWYAAGSIPGEIRQLLKRRRANIVAYELIAAILGIFLTYAILPGTTAVTHNVDNEPALGGIIKGCSKQPDLNNLIGALWFQAAHKVRQYFGRYVPSKSNLADGPSRRCYQLMKQLGARRITFDFGELVYAAESWFERPCQDALM